MTPVKAPGKSAVDENFPVASRFLPARVRDQVMAFYRFARLADDIADDPALPADDKLMRLEDLKRGLEGGVTGLGGDLRRSLDAAGVGTVHALDLLEAFRRDAAGTPIETWGHLMGYCRHSAVPVGRYLLDLFGEHDEAARKSADALCAALQVLNHVQDMGQDYRDLGRVYLPSLWLHEAQVPVCALGRKETTPGLAAVIGRVLDGADALIAAARPLPRLIRSRSLAMQAAATHCCAARLADKLRRRDPLAAKVDLDARDKAAAAAAGLLAGLARGRPR